MFNSILNKGRYLSSAIIYSIDIFISLLASLVVMWMYSVITAQTLFSHTVFATWMTAAFVGSSTAFILTRSYSAIIRYSTLEELAIVTDSILGKELVISASVMIFAASMLSPSIFLLLIIADFFISVALMVLVRILMVMVYAIFRRRSSVGNDRKRLLIYNTTGKSVSLVPRLSHSKHFEVLGFVEDKKNNSSKTLLGYPIYTFSDIKDIASLKETLNANGIIFATDGDARREKDHLLNFVHTLDMKSYIAPSIDEINEVRPFSSGIRNIRIEDLLGRDEIKISLEEIKENLRGKTVLVTGAAGSIGSELCRQLAHLEIGKLIMLDNAETPLHNVRLEFEDKFNWVDFQTIICDVRIKRRLEYAFKNFNPDIVFHAAAYKHVPLMEENPCESVHVNLIGSKNVADLCVVHDVEKMIMISTDKAVNPTNIMGCSKRLAEIYVQSLGMAIHSGKVKGKTQFITTRFGNVLGSNGSVIPRFTEQISQGGPITVTHPEIKRYFMTIPEACRLVMEASVLGSDTEIFVFDMGVPVKIVDLAKRMVQLAGFELGKDINIKFTGLRPGEKLYEEVLASKENTLPTDHPRIHRAKVRDYEYAHALEACEKMDKLAEDVNIRELVLTMKRVVPEFKSQCSKFEELDKIIEEENKDT